MNLSDDELMHFIHTISFGQKIRFLRQRNHLSRSELADRTGFTRRTVFNWENERTKPKTIETLERLCRFFHVDFAFFLPDSTCYTTGVRSDTELWQSFKDYCEDALGMTYKKRPL